MANLYFKYGPMGSSKTLRLLATAYDFEHNGVQIMVLKPTTDTRDGRGIIHSRAGLERKCVMIEDDMDLYKAIKAYCEVLEGQGERLKWVLIDECQFLTEDQVDQLSDVVDYLGVNVICYGLRTDFKSRLFEGSRRLFEIADKIEEIKSTCSCGERKTSINARFDMDGELVVDGPQVEIEGNGNYKPLCRKCWKDMLREAYAKQG